MGKDRQPQAISEALREAIRGSGLNPNELQNATNGKVLSDSISRFLRGEQSLRLDAADKLASVLRLSVKLPPKNERRPIVLQAKDYINAIIDEYNVKNPGAAIPHTGGHFVTLHKFCDGEKIQALFKRIDGKPQIQVGVVLDSNDPARNRGAAKQYRTWLAKEIESGRIEEVPTATNVNVGLLRRFQIESGDALPDLAKQIVAEAQYILSRIEK